MKADVTEFYAKDRAEWRRWLEENHTSEQSVWLVFNKGKQRTLSYDDIVEEALCFGWIDSVAYSVDDKRSKLYISKRKPKSVWSKPNKARITKLRTSGLMTSAGEGAVRIGQENGMWNHLNKSDAGVMPQELTDLLNKNQKAKDFFNSLSPSTKKVILEWIYSAKKPETKLDRIKKTVDLAEQGIKAR